MHDLIHDFHQDLRFGLRSLLRSPTFTTIALLTLAVGIGANTALFSVFDGVLLRPLAYVDADRLVTVLEEGRAPTSPANFIDLRDTLSTVSDLTAASPWWPVLDGEGPAQQFPGLLASPSLFALLRAEAALGRVFDPTLDGGSANDSPRGEAVERVVVLGHEAWQGRFGGDPAILGRALNLDGQPHTVIGVMPAGFRFPPFWATEAEFWAPFRDDPEMWAQRGGRFLRVFGRLSPGADVTGAQQQVETLARRLETRYPEANDGLAYVVEPLAEPVVGGVRGGLTALLVGVGFVLLIACANVSNLLLTRAAGRRREIAVRTALGAPRRRLVRLLLTENMLLAVGAGALGWLFALWGVEALVALAPPEVPRLDEVHLDHRALFFTLTLSLATGLAFGLLPTLGFLRRNLGGALAQGGRRPTGHGGETSRGILVVCEVALALVLLIAAGLVGRHLWDLWRLDPGLRTRGVMTFTLPFAGTPHAEPERQQAFFDQIVDSVSALPGVENAALINHLHLGGDLWGWGFEVEGQAVANPSEAPRASYRVVSEGLFAAARIPLLAGRGFDHRDAADHPPVVVVNQSLAERHWAGEQAIGRRIRGLGSDSPWLEVVGVVGDVRQWDLADEIRPEVYFPYRQNPDPWWTQTSLMVTTSGEPTVLLRPVEQALARFAPGVPAAKPRALTEILHRQRWQPRFNATLLTLFAGTALLLAAVGVYGVMGTTVALRRSELGLRAALGAEAHQLIALVVGRGLRLTVAGLVIGTLGAQLSGNMLAHLIPGVAPHDPLLLGGSAALLAIVALAAAILPARRAGRVDPMTTLREE